MENYLVARANQGDLYVIWEATPPDTGWFLFHHGEDGRFKGDTWHMSVEDAIHQARYVAPDLANATWTEVRGTLEDALTAARCSRPPNLQP